MEMWKSLHETVKETPVFSISLFDSGEEIVLHDKCERADCVGEDLLMDNRNCVEGF